MAWNYSGAGYCQHFTPQYRSLMGVDFWSYPPTLLSSHNFAFAPSGTTAWDTRGTIYGSSVGVTEVGTWRYGFQSASWANNCTPSTRSTFTEKSLNVVGCLPKFHPGAGSRIPLDGQEIRVSVPVQGGPLEAAINAAKDAWKTRLSASGININVGANIYVLCQPTDNHCIEYRVQTPPNNLVACAETQQFPGANGENVNRTLTYVRPGYLEWEDEYRIAVLTHEFGHLFDLQDQDPYCTNGSIMNTPQTTTCTGTMSGSGLSTEPLPSDVLPVVKTTLGNTPKKMCG